MSIEIKEERIPLRRTMEQTLWRMLGREVDQHHLKCKRTIRKYLEQLIYQKQHQEDIKKFSTTKKIPFYKPSHYALIPLLNYRLNILWQNEIKNQKLNIICWRQFIHEFQLIPIYCGSL